MTVDMQIPRQSEGFLIESQGEQLYEPREGLLVEDKVREVLGGAIHCGLYHSERATHRVGVYVPSELPADSKLPTVLMTTALMTGVRGHNERVATEMMRAGFPVIVKGPPRYRHTRDRALSLTEDSNEMLGAAREVATNGIVGTVEKLLVYGESQGAMKGFGALALAGAYGFEVEDSLLVAPCYMDKIQLTRPLRQLGSLASLASGTFDYIRHTSNIDRTQLKGTFSRKDLHHHLAVVPVLVSGETGRFLPHIAPDQRFSVQLFGKDGWSRPKRTKKLLEERFTEVDVAIDERFGHIDGIMNEATTALRGAMLWGVRQRTHGNRLATIPTFSS